MVSSVLRGVLDLDQRACAAGTAMATRIITGMTVQMISTLVLCTRVVSGTAPLDLRNVTIDQIMTPNTTTPMTTQTQKISMCRS